MIFMLEMDVLIVVGNAFERKTAGKGTNYYPNLGFSALLFFA
jgi:hypothetical protein